MNSGASMSKCFDKRPKVNSILKINTLDCCFNGSALLIVFLKKMALSFG